MTARRYDIAYGMVENPARVLSTQSAVLPQGGSVLSPSFASFSSESPALRLNSAGWTRLTAERMATLRTHAALKDYCRRRIESKASIFDRPLQQFLAGYLDAVEEEVRNNAASLPGGASWDAALSCADDWFFSAFLPLPNAYLGLNEEEREKTGAESGIHFDAMFWTGRCLVAVTLERLSMQTPRRRHEQARFAALRPDITFVTVSAGKNRTRLQSCLPGVCDHFWQGLRQPLGPYRPDAFRWQPSA